MVEQIVANIGVALGIGLSVGIERERRKGEGPTRGSAGLRTFAIASLLGAASYLVGSIPLLAVATLGTVALSMVSYRRNAAEISDNFDPGVTTEIALMLTTILGGMAITAPGQAAGICVALVALLAAREPLHRFVRTVLTESELHDALILSAAALVVFPLLPDCYIGPFAAINPRVVWRIALLMMTLSSAGHIAMRLLGPRFGVPLSGLASGFVSSAATIAMLGGKTKANPMLLRPAIAGALLSTVATMIQLALVLRTTDQQLFSLLVCPLTYGGLVALLGAAIHALSFNNRSTLSTNEHFSSSAKAFDITTVCWFTFSMVCIMLIAAGSNNLFGKEALIISTGIAGLIDSHAAGTSIGNLTAAGKITPIEAVLPVLVVLATNTVTKLLACFSTGSSEYAIRVGIGLLMVLTTVWLSAW